MYERRSISESSWFVYFVCTMKSLPRENALVTVIGRLETVLTLSVVE